MYRQPDITSARIWFLLAPGAGCIVFGHRWWWLDNSFVFGPTEEVQRPKADNTAPKFSPTAGQHHVLDTPLPSMERPSPSIERSSPSKC